MKTISENCENAHQALFDELEARYGSAVAQGIIDQIREVEAPDQSGAPDYMAVKATSEMLELFRGEAQALLKRLKMQPQTWGEPESNITSLEKRKLEKEFKRYYRLYWTSMKLFYPLYEQAMVAARKPKFPRRSTAPLAIAA